MSAQDLINDISYALSRAEEFLNGAHSSLSDLESALEDEGNANLSSQIDDVLSTLSRVEDSIPSQYSEVGSVEGEADDAHRYLTDAVDALTNLQRDLG